MERMKVGVLVNEATISQYTVDFLRYLADSNLFEAPKLIVCTHVENPVVSLRAKVASYLY